MARSTPELVRALRQRYENTNQLMTSIAAAAGISSQCPLQTDASSSQTAEIVKMTGFDIRTFLLAARHNEPS